MEKSLKVFFFVRIAVYANSMETIIVQRLFYTEADVPLLASPDYPVQIFILR
jgi:hypothetical protein